MSVVTKNVRISGRVHGVGFRIYMQRKAAELGVAGWVRNRLDGSVEAVVQGEAEAVEAIIAWSRHGPRSAVVAEVRVSEDSGEHLGFKVLPTE